MGTVQHNGTRTKVETVKRYLRATALVLVVLGAALFGPSAVSPAEALYCPPQSSICNPVGLAILAESDAMSLGVNTLATGGVAAAGVGLYGWKSGWFESAPGVLSVVDTPAGWLGGVNTFTASSYSYGWTDVAGLTTITAAVNGPAIGQAGTLVVGVTYAHPSGAYTAETAGPYVVVDSYEGSCGTWAGQVNGGSGLHTSASFTAVIPPSQPSCVWHVEVGRSRTNFIAWYPEGHALRPPSAAPGSGVVTRTIVCEDAAGVRSTFTDSTPGTAGTRFELPALACPDGSVLVEYGSAWTPSGGETQTIVPDTESAVPSIPAEYPACLTPGACAMTLWQVTPGGLVSCGGLAVACPDWYADPLRGDNYECRWGPYTVLLSYCSTMRTPGEVRPNTRLNPDGSQTVVEWPSASPDPTIDGDTYTGTDPGTGIGPSGEPGPTDETGGECFPRGWGAFNPAEWVVKPVGCALVWAFVPTQSATQLERAQTAIDATTPALWAAGLGGMFADFNLTGSGCEGPELHLVMFGLDQRYRPFSACAAPMSTVAAWCRAASTILIVVVGSMACVRALGSGLGWKPSAGGDS